MREEFKKLKQISLCLIISFGLFACGGNSNDSVGVKKTASAKSDRSHFFDKPYECFFTSISKTSGKTFTYLYYYHPEKNWKIKLSKPKKDFSNKIAMFDTSDGKYAGSYTGVYPDIKQIKFSSFFPNQKSTSNSRYSKLKKDDCKLTKDLSVFELPDVKSLVCMDMKKTGICDALKKS